MNLFGRVIDCDRLNKSDFLLWHDIWYSLWPCSHQLQLKQGR